MFEAEKLPHEIFQSFDFRFSDFKFKFQTLIFRFRHTTNFRFSGSDTLQNLRFRDKDESLPNQKEKRICWQSYIPNGNFRRLDFKKFKKEERKNGRGYITRKTDFCRQKSKQKFEKALRKWHFLQNLTGEIFQIFRFRDTALIFQVFQV